MSRSEPVAVEGAASLGAVLVVAGLVEVLQVRLQQDGHPQQYQEVDLQRIHLLRIAKCHVRLDKDSAAPAHRTWLGYPSWWRGSGGGSWTRRCPPRGWRAARSAPWPASSSCPCWRWGGPRPTPWGGRAAWPRPAPCPGPGPPGPRRTGGRRWPWTCHVTTAQHCRFLSLFCFVLLFNF